MQIRRLTLVFFASCALLGSNAPASAQTTQTGSIVDDAVAALQRDPVYVAPAAAATVGPSEADDLRRSIEQADAGPVYIAVLPDDARREAGGSASGVLRQIAEGVGEQATYAVVVGSELRAGATYGEPVAPLADAAVQAKGGEDAAAVLLDFVARVDAARSGGAGDGSGGSPGFGSLPLLLLIGGGGLFVFSRMRRRQAGRQAQAQLEEVREVALDDLVALGEDLRSLDLDVEMPGADPRAKTDYVRALECYERATSELDRARRPQDLEPVTSALEEGRYAIACARARLEGREPPERRPPCFFDPRHGPSARDVEWAPPGGEPRLVPACAADAQRVEDGDEPSAREISVGGRMTPYWNAPWYYGGWAGGYFGGGLLEGMLLGSMLGGGLGFGGHGDADPAGDFGGGDFGGGDFGGGDFGGGDFGGGDFGGGDFGGG